MLVFLFLIVYVKINGLRLWRCYEKNRRKSRFPSCFKSNSLPYMILKLAVQVLKKHLHIFIFFSHTDTLGKHSETEKAFVKSGVEHQIPSILTDRRIRANRQLRYEIIYGSWCLIGFQCLWSDFWTKFHTWWLKQEIYNAEKITQYIKYYFVGPRNNLTWILLRIQCT